MLTAPRANRSGHGCAVSGRVARAGPFCNIAHAGWVDPNSSRVWCLLVGVRAWSIVVQHVCQDVLRVLQALRHLLIIGVKCLAERHDRPLALLVDVGDQTVVRVEQDLRVVLEVDLHDLVAQPEHDGVPGSHPLLDVDGAGLRLHLVLYFALHVHLCMLVTCALLGCRRLQVALKVLEQCDFLLELLREL